VGIERAQRGGFPHARLRLGFANMRSKSCRLRHCA
jgi:hypothetical protein